MSQSPNKYLVLRALEHLTVHGPALNVPLEQCCGLWYQSMPLGQSFQYITYEPQCMRNFVNLMIFNISCMLHVPDNVFLWYNNEAIIPSYSPMKRSLFGKFQ